MFVLKCSESEVESFAHHKKQPKSAKSKWDPEWVPIIVFMNSNGVTNIWEPNVPYMVFTTDGRNALQRSNWGMGKKHLGFDPSEGHWIHGMWHGDFSLTEEMELEAFPLDCQDFTINMRSVIGADKCMFFAFFCFFFFFLFFIRYMVELCKMTHYR